MVEMEFIEAVARMAENLDLGVVEGGRREGLHYRFEELMYDLVHKLCSEEMKTQFPIPTISMFDVK